MSRAWRGGTTREWREIRRRVLLANLNANRGRCQVQVGILCPRHGRPCRGVCTRIATQVHHTRGKRFGDDVRHLVASCKACNLHVGDPTTFNPQPTPRSRW